MISEKVLVFIPVKNEEKTIREIINEVFRTYPEWDILVVDDGSDDSTVEEARKTKATVIPLLLNTRGVGAVLAAFMVAYKGKYDYLTKIDGDGQQEVFVLKLLIDALKENYADIAVGSRYMKKQRETDSFVKVIGRVVSSSLLNFKLGDRNRISDCTSGVRAWNSRSIRLLTENYSKQILAHDSVFWLREAVLASSLGLKIYEIPAFYHARKHGKSKSFSLMNMCIFPFRLLFVLLS